MEKINIFVPERISQLLENDARQFEIFKKDMRTVNMNRFLSMLITGYYNSYTEHYRQISDLIIEILQKRGMTDPEDLHASATDIFRKVISQEVTKRKGVYSKRISLKPTSITEPILLYLDSDLDGDSVSQYFCRMFMSYAQNPLNVRERIVHKDTYEFLQKACQNRQAISFVTNRNHESVHEVLPYKISTGKDELFNYLLCQERNKETGIYEAATYRLCRIAKTRLVRKMMVLSDEVQRHLDKMSLYGAQYTINDEEETCVKLSENGVRLFNRIYFGRPVIDRMESKDGATYYYFDCSKNQLFLYFRRFESENAVVLYPESLRQQINDFHKNAIV